MALRANEAPPAPASRIWRGLALVAAVLLAYWPALSAGFVWDDDGHVTRPALRSLHGLWRIWFDLGATQQYYPVLHSAFWLEHRLWGESPLGYHLANVLLHAGAAILVARVLARVDPREGAESRAWFAALLFALHPVCVESVAWISEQKNTLSAVFYLLSALAFLRWQGTRSPGGYALATLLFVLALLSKTVTATLPAALLVALWWRSGRLAWKRDVAPLLPWFALGASGGLLTAWVERTYIGARGSHFALSLGQRILLAGRSTWFYLGKLLWPAHLMFVYPRWDVRAWTAGWAIFPVSVVAVLAAAWLVRNRTRTPFAGFCFFVGSLFPALGFVDVYPFVFSYVADHFQYLASVGIFLIAAAAWDLIRPPALRLVTAGFLLLSLGALTWRQCHAYRNMETLFRETLERNPSSWLAQENLGVVLANRGEVAEAIEHYRDALHLNPDYAETHANYANALAQLRQWPQAEAEYREALRLRPDFELAAGNAAKAEYALASELGNQGRLDEAIGHYEEALRLRPDFPEAAAELGLATLYAGRLEEALARLRAAARLRPGYAPAHAYLGLALAKAGRAAEAVAEYRESLRLNPHDADVHYQLGLALRAIGQPAAAAAEFEAAQLDSKPPR